MNHPNVVTYFGLTEIENTTYVVLAYYNSGSLDSFIGKHTLSLPQIVSIAWDIAAGMKYLAAKEIVHRYFPSFASSFLFPSVPSLKLINYNIGRDLAARNILVQCRPYPPQDDSIIHAVVADFGFSKLNQGKLSAKVGFVFRFFILLLTSWI